MAPPMSPEPPLNTLPVPPTTTLGAGVRTGGRLVLVVAHGGGVTSAPLEDGAVVVVGRAPTAQVTIADASLSREHARFERRGDEVTVVDLGSSNGTLIGGQRITRRALAPGDQVVLGAVVVSLQAFDLTLARLGFTSHDRFRAVLADELVRARGLGRRAVVAMIARTRTPGQGVDAWAAAIRAPLRPFDRAALYAPDVAEVLFPERAAGEVVPVIQEIAARLGAPVRAGLVELPGGGRSLDHLLAAAHDALRAATPARPISIAPGEGMGRPPPTDAPVVASPRMLALYAHVGRAAAASLPVLVHGETGSGKELIARSIHDHGARAPGPFVAINCGAIPDALIHAALFGHERGAFTGADRQAPGVFEQAHRGTLFLDEVGELSAQAQASLLRVLETGTLVRLGGSQAVAVDVRVVAATHRDLEERCRAGAFREDLWYRLNALTLTVPPLRDRPEELRPLVDRFLAAAAAATGRAGLTIDDDALACLAAYAWPGNVRELRNELERAAVLASGDVIGRAELSERILRAAGVTPADGEAADDGDGEDAVALPRGAGGDLKTRVERFEAELLRQALAAADGHQPTAATALGLPLRTLVYKLRKHGLQRGR